ncbi:MAG: GNAT family N-acetyltransferase [Lachnospiraceae bacterium]|nr:GNAT family N-acetyltransferase [Lachnospiraceae bacterium]
MTKEQYAKLFNEMHPGYFERDYVKNVPDSEPASEMLLELKGFDTNVYEKELSGNVTFSLYDGDMKDLKEAVAKVVPHWVEFFNESARIYCGYVDGKIASFCMIQDFGEHIMDGKNCRIGGPGCVGTLPKYRDRGIGLTMVKNVTKILREESYDYSYIHYTYETKWYSKLGYKTFLTWTGSGIK